MLIYLLRHGLTEYNAQKRYQGQRDIPPRCSGRPRRPGCSSRRQSLWS